MEDVLRASLAVGSALQMLRAGTTGPALTAILDQAGAAVRDLTASPFAGALRRVLTEIERCHRTGDHASIRLEVAVQAAVDALAPQDVHDQR